MSYANAPFEGYVEPVRMGNGTARLTLYQRPFPPLAFERDPGWMVPDREECYALWDKYAMPDHIREHSAVVADFATHLAERAVAQGANIHVPSVLASGLLHDLGKYYAITHGGSHAQIGGAWVMGETKNPLIAQGVMHHVRWPWNVDETVDAWLLAYCIIYADKRVMHNRVVTNQERFVDLLERYGYSDHARSRIAASHEQGLEIEAALSRRLKVDLHEHTFDSGQLVKRA